MRKLKIPQKALDLHKNAWLESIKEGLLKALNESYIGGYKVAKNSKEWQLLKKIQKKVDNILIAFPKELDTIKNDIGSKTENISSKIDEKLFENLLPKIFDYNIFSEGKIIDWTNYKGEANSNRSKQNKKWGSFEYLKHLKVNSCPYCNRFFTLTIKIPQQSEDEIIIKPELDHFFCKSEYPYLAISLYNLVPSCTLCNRLKHNKIFELNSHLNPFEDDFHDLYEFEIIFKDKYINGDFDSFDLILKPRITGKDVKITNHDKVFHLKRIYREHKDYVAEIIENMEKYNKDCTDTINSVIPKSISIEMEDLKQIITGEYFEDEHINRRPLTKLKIDVCRQLGL